MKMPWESYKAGDICIVTGYINPTVVIIEDLWLKRVDRFLNGRSRAFFGPRSSKY